MLSSDKKLRAWCFSITPLLSIIDNWFIQHLQQPAQLQPALPVYSSVEISLVTTVHLAESWCWFVCFWM